MLDDAILLLQSACSSVSLSVLLVPVLLCLGGARPNAVRVPGEKVWGQMVGSPGGALRLVLVLASGNKPTRLVVL